MNFEFMNTSFVSYVHGIVHSLDELMFLGCHLQSREIIVLSAYCKHSILLTSDTD